MSFVMQSESWLHLFPMMIEIDACALAFLFVPHAALSACVPSLSVLGPVNIAGEVVSVASGTPSISRSTSITPSGVSHVTVIGNDMPDCTALPVVGAVNFTVGAAAPAGPNRFVMMSISFCVAVPVSIHGCVLFEHVTPNALHVPLPPGHEYRQSLPHTAPFEYE